MTGWLQLEDKICVVTGGGGGIGRAIGAVLTEAGAKVALLDRDAESVSAAAKALDAKGGRAIAIPCDIADPKSVEAAKALVERELGTADVLVNNAGVLAPGSLAEIDLAEWNRVLSINLTGYLICAQAFGRPMLSRGAGALVHIASIAGHHPQGFSGAYSVAKVGVMMLSRQLALEWGPRGVRSNVVCPGMIRTPMSESFYQHPGVAEARAAIVPRGRVGKPEDIADAVAFLASPRADYVNGEDVLVDGGFCTVLMAQAPRPGFDRPGVR
jgi:NAD(P)-dependent dehydrogenase (short-subunit alcohol dehydrogenase family)